MSEVTTPSVLRTVACGTVFRWMAVCCLSYFPVGVSVVIGKGKQSDRGYGALEKNMEFGLFSWLVSWHSHCKLQLTWRIVISPILNPDLLQLPLWGPRQTLLENSVFIFVLRSESRILYLKSRENNPQCIGKNGISSVLCVVEMYVSYTS